jgi:hypothetical protein
MQLDRQARLPLLVGHLKKDRSGALPGDVELRVDLPEGGAGEAAGQSHG